MAPQIARACIAADYECLFDELDPVPNFELTEAALTSSNRHYSEYLGRKIACMGTDSGEPKYHSHSTYEAERMKDAAYAVLMAEIQSR